MGFDLEDCVFGASANLYGIDFGCSVRHVEWVRGTNLLLLTFSLLSIAGSK